VIWYVGALPVMSNDALAYHLPAAVQWLRTGRLGLYEAWFYNPANVYSPLAGSTFLAWSMAPMGNDLLARFVQAPALPFLFLGMLRLSKLLGVPATLAALVAAAAVLSRPFVSQVTFPKDDLFMGAFFLVAAVGLGAGGDDRLSAWRAGVGLGLFLATKYTALFSLPLFLLMIDAPARAGWRRKQWAIAAGCVLLLAGPWYVHNAMLTGNPIYPTEVRVLGVTVLPGLLTLQRGVLLRSLSGVWSVLTGTYYAPTPALFALLLAGWLAAAWSSGASALLRDPIKRLCIVGAPLGVALFVLTSPYGEIRFVYPSLLLLFACLALGLGQLRLPTLARHAVAAAVLLLAAGTAYPFSTLLVPLSAAVAAGAAGVMAVALHYRRIWLSTTAQVLGTAAGAFAVVMMLVYVYWPTYVRLCRETADPAWSVPGYAYGDLGEAWRFVRQNTPADALVAYCNTYLLYPMYGPEFSRRFIYVPTRPGLAHSWQLPHFPALLSGEEIPGAAPRVTIQGASRETWLANLKASGAQYLFIGTRDLGATDAKPFVPPELTYVQADPGHFHRIDTPLPDGRLNASAAVYQITW
jgi:hypothetical protein